MFPRSVADYVLLKKKNLYISNAQRDICAKVILTPVHHAFPRVLYAYSVILLRIGPQPFPSASFLIYNSLVLTPYSVNDIVK